MNPLTFWEQVYIAAVRAGKNASDAKAIADWAKDDIEELQQQEFKKISNDRRNDPR